MVAVLLTRGLLWDNYNGEPDTARYAIGLRLWMEQSPRAPGIINPELSSGYYWLAAAVVRLGDVSFAQFQLLLGGISVVSALVTFPALYALGTMVVSPPAALAATLALLAAPGWWWTGFQGHPQGLSLALQLVSLLAFARAWTAGRPARMPAWLALSWLTLTASLLIKTDAVLLLPAYFGLLVFLRPQSPLASWRRLAGAALITTGLMVMAYLGFTVLQHMIVGPAGELHAEASAHIRRWLTLPQGLVLVGQLTPMLFGPGPITLLVVTFGAARFLAGERGATRWRWAALLGTWMLPGYVFWLLIISNNARHVIPFPVPLFWLGFEWFGRARAGWLAAVAVAAVLANAIVPPNSGLSLYPSMNVPASARLMRERQAELRAAAHRLLDGWAATACYVGRNTQDYVSQYVLEAADARGLHAEVLPATQFVVQLRHADHRPFRRIEVIGLRKGQDAGNPLARPECGIVESVEYDGRGGRRWFFGAEAAAASPLLRGLVSAFGVAPVSAR